MQGTLAQAIALTLYGNAVLCRGLTLDEIPFYPTNSVFAFCEFVRFVDFKRIDNDWQCVDFALTPTEWFNRLHEEGTQYLQLHYAPSGDDRIADRMSVGFVGGGGHWLIETARSGGSGCWEARWEIGDRERPDQRIWRVTYGRIRTGTQFPFERVESLDLEAARLQRNLTRIAAFADRNQSGAFARHFEQALACLNDGASSPNSGYVNLVPPSLLSRDAEQLLSAVQAAWVFGGMGSWNDLAFPDDQQQEYEALSEELFQLLNRAVVLAVNSSAPPIPRVRARPWWRFW